MICLGRLVDERMMICLHVTMFFLDQSRVDLESISFK